MSNDYIDDGQGVQDSQGEWNEGGAPESISNNASSLADYVRVLGLAQEVAQRPGQRTQTLTTTNTLPPLPPVSKTSRQANVEVRIFVTAPTELTTEITELIEDFTSELLEEYKIDDVSFHVSFKQELSQQTYRTVSDPFQQVNVGSINSNQRASYHQGHQS